MWAIIADCDAMMMMMMMIMIVVHNGNVSFEQDDLQ